MLWLQKITLEHEIKKYTECFKTYEYPDHEQSHTSFIKTKYFSEEIKKDLVSPTPTLKKE